MKLHKHKVTILGECPTDLEETYKWIEKGGRICYQSQKKITHDSAKTFVQNILSRKHYSVLETSNFVIRTINKVKFPNDALKHFSTLFQSKYLTKIVKNDYIYIGGNIRAWLEQLNLKSIEQLFHKFKDIQNGFIIVTDHNKIPQELKRISVVYYTSRDVTHELVRHRPASFLQLSQRYVAYRQQLDIIVPTYFEDIASNPEMIPQYDIWCSSMEQAEFNYRLLLQNGAKAERARAVLPNSTATEIIVTADVPEWRIIFDLRTSKAAYSEIQRIIKDTMEQFLSRGWI